MWEALKKMNHRSEQVSQQTRYGNGNKHMKRCTTLYIIREKWIKTTRCPHMPDRRAKWTLTASAGEDVNVLLKAEGKMVQTFWDSLAVSFKTNHILTIWCSNCSSWYLSKKVKSLCPQQTQTLMCIEILLITVKTWKQPKCPSVGK